MTSRSWWHDTSIYALDVRTFQDGDGDGVGDFAGLEKRIDHLEHLGVGCVWLLPFFPSAERDDGYDVTDHCAVDPRLGTLEGIAALCDELHRRGMRIIIDLVANHTSDQHRWFQESRSDERSPFRDFYVWRPEPEDLGVEPIFPGVSDQVWTFDEVADAWYVHRFYDHEPDLNIANAEVRERIMGIVDFWLDVGVDGFRLDAAPYLARKAAWHDATDEGHWFLRDLRRRVVDRRPDAVLIAEADVEPSKYDDFLEHGAGSLLLFDFYLNNLLFLALARQDAEPLRRGIRELRDAGVTGHLVNWVRNHDELDLERLDVAERSEVYKAFAPEERMHVYGRGVRRRFPPMVDGDRRRIELALSITFSLPGIAVLRYGEEIGMGDDLALPERQSVRTPMQWDAGENGGFSSAAPGNLIKPVIEAGPFGTGAVNVSDQEHDPGSLLHWTRRLLQIRRDAPVIGDGQAEALQLATAAVLAIRYDAGVDTVVVCHNLADTPQSLDVQGDLTELFPRGGAIGSQIKLPPFGTAWLRGGGTIRAEDHGKNRAPPCVIG